jgi:hypothetical protein
MEAGLQNGRSEEGLTASPPGVAADADTALAKFPGPVRLYADKRFVRYLSLVFAAMEFVLGKGLLFGTDKRHFVAQLVIFIALLWPLLLIALVVLSRNALALDLDRDGFTINAYAWYRPRRYLWSDVGEFGTRSLRFIALVTYQDRVAGRQRLIPDTYGLGADGLAQLMSQWRQRALGNFA